MQILFLILGIVVICKILWLFAIAPQIFSKPDMSCLKKYDYAHRGLHCKEKGVPENSMKAFENAVQCRFGMELDLQLTKDKKVVVFHDENIKRLCGVDKIVSDLTFEELQNYYLLETSERIPLFEEVLKVVSGVVPLIIELKTYNDTEELCSLTWEILKDYTGHYCVESFSPRIVRWFRVNHPEVVRGQLAEHVSGGKNGFNCISAFLYRNMFTNFYTRPHFEAYNFKHRKNISLRTAKFLFGMQEVSWTLRNEKDFNEAKNEGCLCIFEGIMPEKVSKAEEVKFAEKKFVSEGQSVHSVKK